MTETPLTSTIHDSIRISPQCQLPVMNTSIAKNANS